jgi:hypothetical protein
MDVAILHGCKPWTGLPLPMDAQVRQLFKASVSISLGDSKTTSFWHDGLLFDKPFSKFFPDLFAVFGCLINPSANSSLICFAVCTKRPSLSEKPIADT